MVDNIMYKIIFQKELGNNLINKNKKYHKYLKM